MGMDVSYHGCKVVTVYGVYMPNNSGTTSRTQLYIDPLNQPSAKIEVSSGHAPYLVLGDMNTELSDNATLNKNWYTRKPLNCHSVLLCDFLCDNELIICNTKRSSDNRCCMSGDSLASMFYWTIYKRGNTDGKTLMGRSHTILQQYGLTKGIFNDIFIINNTTVII